MRTELRQVLEQVARRFRKVRLWSSLAVCWLAWALVGLAQALSALYPRGTEEKRWVDGVLGRKKGLGF